MQAMNELQVRIPLFQRHGQVPGSGISRDIRLLKTCPEMERNDLENTLEEPNVLSSSSFSRVQQ
jgi:hypothetical protein